MIKFFKSSAIMLEKIKWLPNVDFTDTMKWIWLLRSLQVIGQLPITIFNRNNSKKPHIKRKVKVQVSSIVDDATIFQSKDNQLESPQLPLKLFNFKHISKIVAYTFCFGLYRFPFIWNFHANVKHCKISSNHNSTMASVVLVPEHIICPIAYYSKPTLHSMQWFCVIFTVGYFCRFLNNWNKFNELEIFKKDNTSEKLQRPGSSGIVKNSVVWWLTAFFTIFLYISLFTCISHTYHLRGGIALKLEFLIRFTLVQITVILEDVKLWLMFLSVETGFQKVIYKFLFMMFNKFYP